MDKPTFDDPVIVRCSSLNDYPDCPGRSATRIFAQDIAAAGFDLGRIGSGIALHVGTAVHKGAEVLVRDKLRGITPSLAAGKDAAVEKLHEKVIEDGCAWDDTSPTPNTAETQVGRMVATYAGDILPSLNPVHVEERLEAHITPRLILSGQKDVAAREPNAIRDVKTGARMRVYTAQIGGYTTIEKAHGRPTEKAVIDFIQRVTVRKEQPPAISAEVPLAQAESAAWAVSRAMERDITAFRFGDPERGIRPGDPWAFIKNPNSQLCSAKFCAAYGKRGPHAFCNEWQEKK